MHRSFGDGWNLGCYSIIPLSPGIAAPRLESSFPSHTQQIPHAALADCRGLLHDQNWFCGPLFLSCRSNFKLVAVNFKLYAIGGQAVSNVECYNPEQDAWNFVAPLPNPLAEFSACECQGKIYVIGGYTTRGKWGPGKWSSSVWALAAWGRTGGVGGSPLVHPSLMLCIAYCIFTYLEKRASCGTSKRGLWCLCMSMKIAWCGRSCEENMSFLPSLEIPPCSQPSCDLAG